MPIFKSIRPSILIDAGVIVSAFYLTNAYFSEEAAIPLSVLLFLLWSRGWALNGETRSKVAIVSMVAMLGFAWGIQSGLLADAIDEAFEYMEAPASGDARFEEAAVAIAGKPYIGEAGKSEVGPAAEAYLDSMVQEQHRKRVESELSSYEQVARWKREDEAIKREKECLAKHKSGSREMRDCLIESQRIDIEHLLERRD